MILVDTSVWVDHLRTQNARLAEVLISGLVLVHPFVIGELALGNLRQRETVLGSLLALRQPVVATDSEVLHFIDRHSLSGGGIGYVDAHLLAAVQLTSGTTLWTFDKRLHRVADRLGMAMVARR